MRAVGFDGSASHEIAPFRADSVDASVSPLAYAPLRWNGAQVAWAHLGLGDGTRFEIVSAADEDNASPSVLMQCSGAVRTFDFLPNGDIVASYQSASGAPASAFDLVVLHPNAVTTECEIVRNLTSLSAGSIVYTRAAMLLSNASAQGARAVLRGSRARCRLVLQ